MPITANTTYPYKVGEGTEASLGATFKKALSYVITAGAMSTVTLTSTLYPSCITQNYSNTPTYNAGYLETERHGFDIAVKSHFDFLKSYDFSEIDADNIVSYLAAYPHVQDFLVAMSGIIENIYPGSGDRKQLQLITDPDTDETLLKFVFNSGLPVDDDFMQRDRMLFGEIKSAGIENGLTNVIFVNA